MKLEDVGDGDLYQYKVTDDEGREITRFSFEELQALLPEIARVLDEEDGKDAG